MIRSRESASVLTDGTARNVKTHARLPVTASSVYFSVNVRTTPCVTQWMVRVNVERDSEGPSVTKCALLGRMDLTVSTGVPVGMGRNVTMLPGTVSVGQAGKDWDVMKGVIMVPLEQGVKRNAAVPMVHHVIILEEGAPALLVGRGSTVTSPAPRDFTAWIVRGSVTVETMGQSVTT